MTVDEATNELFGFSQDARVSLFMRGLARAYAALMHNVWESMAIKTKYRPQAQLDKLSARQRNAILSR